MSREIYHASCTVQAQGSGPSFLSAAAGAALLVSGSVILLPAVGVLALNLFGFTAAGVAGGMLDPSHPSIIGLYFLYRVIGRCHSIRCLWRSYHRRIFRTTVGWCYRCSPISHIRSCLNISRRVGS